MGKWFFITLLLAAPVAAQTDPCPLSDRAKLFKSWRAMSQLLYAVSYRKECGSDLGPDLAAIHSILKARGCSPSSGVGRYYSELVQAPLTPETEHPGLKIIREQHLVGMVRFCDMADALSWPAPDASFLILKPESVPQPQLLAYQQFWAHVDALQTQMTEHLKALHSQ